MGGFWLSAGLCRAAVLSLETEKEQVSQGDIVLVSVKIDNQEECINVVQANIEVGPGLKILGTSQDGSILSLWPQVPVVNVSGTVLDLTGGVPGGYCGRVPGDQGASNMVVKMFLQVLGAGDEFEQDLALPVSTRLEFVSGKNMVLLNDGLGTAAELKLKPLELKIGAPSTTPSNAWSSELAADQIPPEAFTIEPTRDRNVFDGQYYIYFSTVDKQTGVAYYEVQEGDVAWARASSPYLLKNQKLDSVIKVRAVDWAGNYFTAEYRPRPTVPIWRNRNFFMWIGGGLLLLVIILIIRQIKIRRGHEEG